MRAARSEYDAPSVRTADASDIGPQHPARYGQNDREIALNRKKRAVRWLRSTAAERAAVIATLIETCKLNGVDPQAYLADVLARIADHPARRLDQLLPWNWRTQNLVAEAAGSSDGAPRSLITPWPSPDAYAVDGRRGSMRPRRADRIREPNGTRGEDRAVRPKGQSRRPAKPAVLGAFFGRLAA